MRLLLESGSPVLTIPNGWDGASIGSNIIIGWNGSRAARHVAGASIPFLVDANHVTLRVGSDDYHPRACCCPAWSMR